LNIVHVILIYIRCNYTQNRISKTS